MSNEENTNPASGFVLSGPLYEKVKWFVVIVAPALLTLYFTIATILNSSHTATVMGIGTAIITFLGVVLGISTSSYRTSPNRYVGETYLTPTDDGWKRVYNVTSDTIDPNKKELVFKAVDTQSS